MLPVATAGPLPPPRDLTVPAPGSTTARDVLSRAIGRTLRELRPLLGAHAAAAPRDAAAIDRVLGASLRDGPGPLASLLRRPHVGALVRTLRATPPPGGAALAAELRATLAFDLAHLGALPDAVTLGHLPPRIVSLVARSVARVPPDARQLVFAPGAPPPLPLDEEPFRDIEGDTVLALADNNPLAMHEAHPDKHGNAVDLGGRPVDAWIEALRGAFALVAAYLPELREEMRPYVQAIVPVGYFADRHLSASYREAIGLLYLSLHPSEMTMVEALVHEYQHNKLNALFELDDVLENAHAPLYASPVRPDPRPLAGVLLAVHAFAPVALLYRRMQEAGDPRARAPDFDRRRREIERIDREGADVLLAHARPTAVGRGLLDEIGRVLA